MSPVLDQEDISTAAGIVRRELAARVARSGTGRPGQPLANEFFELVVNQSLVPILVAVTSTRLTDVLKERRLKRLKRAEAAELAAELAGAEIATPGPPDSAAIAELRALLGPMGLSDPDIEALIELVRQQVGRRNGQA